MHTLHVHIFSGIWTNSQSPLSHKCFLKRVRRTSAILWLLQGITCVLYKLHELLQCHVYMGKALPAGSMQYQATEWHTFLRRGRERERESERNETIAHCYPTPTERRLFSLKRNWWLFFMTRWREPTPGTSTWRPTTTQLLSTTLSLRLSEPPHNHQTTRNCSPYVTTACLLEGTTSIYPSGWSITPTGSYISLMEGSWWLTLSLSWPGCRSSCRWREEWITQTSWG